MHLLVYTYFNLMSFPSSYY